jgi:hypothetical protein
MGELLIIEENPSQCLTETYLKKHLLIDILNNQFQLNSEIGFMWSNFREKGLSAMDFKNN